MGDPLEGALAMRLATRQAHIDHHRCCILATHELDAPRLPPQELFAGDPGQAHAERGFRFLTDPQSLASARARNKPERLRALLMVLTIGVVGDAALESRIRPALKAHAAPFPDQPGPRLQTLTARWVFHDFVGIQG